MTTKRITWEPTTINGRRYYWRAELGDGSTYRFAYTETLAEAVSLVEGK